MTRGHGHGLLITVTVTKSAMTATKKLWSRLALRMTLRCIQFIAILFRSVRRTTFSSFLLINSLFYIASRNKIKQNKVNESM